MFVNNNKKWGDKHGLNRNCKKKKRLMSQWTISDAENPPLDSLILYPTFAIISSSADRTSIFSLQILFAGQIQNKRQTTDHPGIYGILYTKAVLTSKQPDMLELMYTRVWLVGQV